MSRRTRVPRAVAFCVLAAAILGCRPAGVVWDELRGGSTRIGPVLEASGKPQAIGHPDLGASLRLSQTVIHSILDVRMDLSVRNATLPTIGARTLKGYGFSGRVNLVGGYPRWQEGIVVGWDRLGGMAGHSWHIGAGTAFSLARGQRMQVELEAENRYPTSKNPWGFRLSIASFFSPKALFSRIHPGAMNVVPDSGYDANGLPVNPRWARSRPDADGECRFWFAQTSMTPVLIYRPECTSHPVSLNQPLFLHPPLFGFTCGVRDVEPIIRGHVNWFPVTIRNDIHSAEYESGKTRDNDVNLYIYAPGLASRGNGSGRDAVQRQLIEAEFRATETFRHFNTQDGGPLWDGLIDLERDASALGSLLGGRRAVLTGLLGLDGVHFFQTELHPVWALAVDVTNSAARSVPFEPGEEQWLWFIRNTGDEGECADGVLPWHADSAGHYSLEIPWPAHAVDVEVLPSPSGAVGLVRKLAIEIDSPGVRLVADLPNPLDRDSTAVVYGTLRLRWIFPVTALAARDTAGVRTVAPPRRRRGEIRADSIPEQRWATRSTAVTAGPPLRIRRGPGTRARVLDVPTPPVSTQQPPQPQGVPQP